METFILTHSSTIHSMHNCNLTIYCNMMDMIERISWTDHARNEPRGEEYLTYNKKKKANWIGHILCRKRPLKYFTDRKIEGRIAVVR